YARLHDALAIDAVPEQTARRVAVRHRERIDAALCPTRMRDVIGDDADDGRSEPALASLASEHDEREVVRCDDGARRERAYALGGSTPQIHWFDQSTSCKTTQSARKKGFAVSRRGPSASP